MTHSESFKELIEQSEANPLGEKDNAVEELPEVVSEAFDSTLTSLATSRLEREILEHAVQGVSVATISFNLGIPEAHIRTYLRNPKVVAYLKELKEAINEINQMKISDTLRKMVDARIDNLGEDEDMSNLSSKDTLDIIKVFSDITKDIAKGKEQEKTDDVFVQIYNQILSK